MNTLHGASTRTSKKSTSFDAICYNRLKSADFAQKTSAFQRLLNIFR